MLKPPNKLLLPHNEVYGELIGVTLVKVHPYLESAKVLLVNSLKTRVKS